MHEEELWQGAPQPLPWLTPYQHHAASTLVVLGFCSFKDTESLPGRTLLFSTKKHSCSLRSERKGFSIPQGIHEVLSDLGLGFCEPRQE